MKTKLMDAITTAVVVISETLVKVVPVVVGITFCYQKLTLTGSVLSAIVAAGYGVILSLSIVLPIYWLVMVLILINTK